MGALAQPPMSEPPTAPAVASQQGGPVGQYLQNYKSQDGQGPAGAPPMALVEQKLNGVASELRDVAKVLVMSKPALMPVLQKMIQAGAMLMQEVNKDKQQGQTQGPPQSGPQQESAGEKEQQETSSPTMDQQ